ncbi:phytoene dehydrogenase [Mycolicibacterium duvalii]|uniref:Phytoene dehydrogenase n=1 Tax=Mycolicibacterium duvalii TaxID=39688 RepID=A0A7I7JZY2_9MYCO|nr:NAD(P)/FAD-dependent oxidoreductase [Mycolicibacterium duvalii]MCV7366748.1 NAD(P)/FAD-dependent oxidoreductase [Mycolicibacterium duvalii]PEG43881.1 phytoene dehydrogenase [Mycolicibacterium duvalii]BBX16791.1 phytoene dehydrogenase [Mycolicibacterium duvalii]
MATTRSDAEAIVIGAGTGGLTAAAYLAALGRRVLVVDRQPMPGGNTASFTHDGYEFDIGLHYLGGWAGSHPGLRAVLEPLGIDLRYRELDPDGFDELVFDGMTFRVPRGIEEFRARLHEQFPDERDRIDRHLRRIATITDELEAAAPVRFEPRSLLSTVWRTRVAAATAPVTLGRWFDHLGCSPRLRTVLNWCHGIAGVAPSEISLGMHAVGVMHYLAGAWYPEGGGRSVVNALLRVILDHGGEVLLDSEAELIHVDDHGVCGVRVTDSVGTSHELRTRAVISAADIKHTYGRLLAEVDIPARVQRRVRNYRMAAPLFVDYLILDRDLRAEGVSNHNWLVCTDDDVDGLYKACARGESRIGSAFITAASVKDPDNPRLCRAGQTNLQVMSIAPAGRGFWGDNDAYARRKSEFRDALLAVAERAIPGLRDAIVYEESASPVTWERYLRNSGGTSYGIAATPDQWMLRRPGAKTDIPGLFLAGASTRTGHGITGVAIGGMEAAALAAGAPRWPLHRSARTVSTGA